ncbi:hypothetical protein VTO42DRAFT_3355 [Malbranchea cinnamomea]
MWASAPEVKLESKEHRDLLDIIDNLRSQGISQYVDLPQIIVCGDQSAGKSSVLEAISGLSFPTKDTLCTRFPTELILRRSSVPAINISIVPGPERSEEEKQRLRDFTSSLPTDSPSLDHVVEEAKEAMGLSTPGSSRVFSTDVLRVELSGPQQPHLTMVDLPGLFEAGNRDQSEEDAEMVKSLVLSYMRSERSVILAVVSAKSDFALQSVTKYARQLDPEGLRTLGLITKPDTLDIGSDSERAYIDLAENRDVKFRLGWHVLRNRDYHTRSVSAAERDRIEQEFFSKGTWSRLNPAHVGISALRPRLSHILRDQIINQLPDVLADVNKGIHDCKCRLEKLGPSRSTIQEQRRYLLRMSNSFHIYIRAAADGMYHDAFFGTSDTEEGEKRRLRAVVQNTLLSFADEMRKNGHAVKIYEDEHENWIAANSTREITRSRFADQVKKLMAKTRGCELPGTYNPLIISELFRDQCKPWKGLITQFVADIVNSVHYTIGSVLDYAAEEDTAAKIRQEIINPGLSELRENLDKKVAEILEPHLSGHPITYNHYLTESVQKARTQREKRRMEKAFQTIFSDLRDRKEQYWINPKALLSQIVEGTEADMDNHASFEAIDMMEAYYKVALKKVVDDVSVLAVEQCLIKPLPSLFTPEIVFNLKDDVVRRIAGESEESIIERERLTDRLRVLETGLQQLSRLSNHAWKPRVYNSTTADTVSVSAQ